MTCSDGHMLDYTGREVLIEAIKIFDNSHTVVFKRIDLEKD